MPTIYLWMIRLCANMSSNQLKTFERDEKRNASAGNRTRAARVAGEHSTTEPPMLITQDV